MEAVVVVVEEEEEEEEAGMNAFLKSALNLVQIDMIKWSTFQGIMECSIEQVLQHTMQL